MITMSPIVNHCATNPTLSPRVRAWWKERGGNQTETAERFHSILTLTTQGGPFQRDGIYINLPALIHALCSKHAKRIRCLAQRPVMQDEVLSLKCIYAERHG